MTTERRNTLSGIPPARQVSAVPGPNFESARGAFSTEKLVEHPAEYLPVANGVINTVARYTAGAFGAIGYAWPFGLLNVAEQAIQREGLHFHFLGLHIEGIAKLQADIQSLEKPAAPTDRRSELGAEPAVLPQSEFAHSSSSQQSALPPSHSGLYQPVLEEAPEPVAVDEATVRRLANLKQKQFRSEEYATALRIAAHTIQHLFVVTGVAVGTILGLIAALFVVPAAYFKPEIKYWFVDADDNDEPKRPDLKQWLLDANNKAKHPDLWQMVFGKKTGVRYSSNKTVTGRRASSASAQNESRQATLFIQTVTVEEWALVDGDLPFIKPMRANPMLWVGGFVALYVAAFFFPPFSWLYSLSYLFSSPFGLGSLLCVVGFAIGVADMFNVTERLLEKVKVEPSAVVPSNGNAGNIAQHIRQPSVASSIAAQQMITTPEDRAGLLQAFLGTTNTYLVAARTRIEGQEPSILKDYPWVTARITTALDVVLGDSEGVRAQKPR